MPAPGAHEQNASLLGTQGGSTLHGRLFATPGAQALAQRQSEPVKAGQTQL
jgi:hypothetical protein